MQLMHLIRLLPAQSQHQNPLWNEVALSFTVQKSAYTLPHRKALISLESYAYLACYVRGLEKLTLLRRALPILPPSWLYFFIPLATVRIISCRNLFRLRYDSIIGQACYNVKHKITTKLKPNKKSFPQDRDGTGVKNCGKVEKTEQVCSV